MSAKAICLDEFVQILEQSILVNKVESAYFVIHTLIYQGKKTMLINNPAECFIIQ